MRDLDDNRQYIREKEEITEGGKGKSSLDKTPGRSFFKGKTNFKRTFKHRQSERKKKRDKAYELSLFQDLDLEQQKRLVIIFREGLSCSRAEDKIKKYREEHGRSESTEKQYIDAILRAPWDKGDGHVLLWYIDMAEKRSPSWAKLHRAALLRATVKSGKKNLEQALRALPPIRQKQVTVITKMRREKKDLERMEKVIAHMRYADGFALKTILATGARVSELSSLKLSFREKGVGVSLMDIKKHTERNFFIPKKTWAFDTLFDLNKFMGPDLFREHLKTKNNIVAFEMRWTRCCKKYGLIPEKYSCHALRHQHATELKILFQGKDARKKIAKRLGHSEGGGTTTRYGDVMNGLGLLLIKPQL